MKDGALSAQKLIPVIDMATALSRDPNMKVSLLNGIYDPS